MRLKAPHVQKFDLCLDLVEFPQMRYSDIVESLQTRLLEQRIAYVFDVLYAGFDGPDRRQRECVSFKSMFLAVQPIECFGPCRHIGSSILEVRLNVHQQAIIDDKILAGL